MTASKKARIVAAWKLFLESTAPAWELYEKAKASAWKVYNETVTTIEAEP